MGSNKFRTAKLKHLPPSDIRWAEMMGRYDAPPEINITEIVGYPADEDVTDLVESIRDLVKKRLPTCHKVEVIHVYHTTHSRYNWYVVGIQNENLLDLSEYRAE